MPSARLILRAHRTAADGRAPVHLRIRHRGHPDAALALGLRVEAARWDPTRARLRGRTEEVTQTNALLAEYESEARAVILAFKRELRPPIPGDLRAAIAERLGLATPGDGALLVAALDEWAEGYRLRGQAGTWLNARTTARRLARHLGAGAASVPLAALTPARVRRFYEWMLAEGNSPSTAGGRIKSLRSFCALAVREGRLPADPTGGLRLAAPRTERRVLTPEEVERLAHAGAHHPDPDVRLAVDFWLFSFYAAGIRFIDAVSLPPSAVTAAPDGRALLVYTQAKTGKPIAHLLPEAAAEIAARYLRPDAPTLFPLLEAPLHADPVAHRAAVGRANTRVNRRLKIAAEAAGIPPLSAHSARHSFATGRVSAGANLRAVQRALGHATLAQTAAYVSALGLDVLDLDAL